MITPPSENGYEFSTIVGGFKTLVVRVCMISERSFSKKYPA